jgi:hypothetical protein
MNDEMAMKLRGGTNSKIVVENAERFLSTFSYTSSGSSV